MSIMNERVEAAFADEYTRLRHEGFDKLIEKRLDELLFMVYRRGYVRGHSDRSREVQQAEDQAIREGRLPMNVNIRYEDDRLFIEGKDVTPKRPDKPERQP